MIANSRIGRFMVMSLGCIIAICVTFSMTASVACNRLDSFALAGIVGGSPTPEKNCDGVGQAQCDGCSEMRPVCTDNPETTNTGWCAAQAGSNNFCSSAFGCPSTAPIVVCGQTPPQS